MQVKERTRIQRKLEESRRITPREALEAYEETGLTPARHVYVEGDEACPFGALMWRDGALLTRVMNGGAVGIIESDLDRWAGGRMGYVGSHYRAGFVTGFDGGDCPVGALHWERKGWHDGRRVGHFVFSS